MIYIYALVDPDSNSIRYIGKSKSPETRFFNHLREAQNQKGRLHRHRWLRRLLRCGQLPILYILEKIKDENWQKREKWWINYGQEQGWPLVNTAKGGEGRSSSCSIETKQKISAANKGKKRSSEIRARMSRLSEDQIRAIRTMLHRGCSLTDIAEEFGVSNSVISSILRGKTYEWVKGNEFQLKDGEKYRHNLRVKTDIQTKVDIGRKGWRHSAESKAKIGTANKGNTVWRGRKHTKEAKVKISKARGKLLPDQVCKIRIMLDQGINRASLAEKFKVSINTIHNIACGRRYRYI